MPVLNGIRATNVIRGEGLNLMGEPLFSDLS